MPGAVTDRRTAYRRGIATLVVAAVVGAGTLCLQHTRSDGRVRIQVLTAQIGAGISSGSPVGLDGVPVGHVERIDSTAPGRVRLTMAVDAAAAGDLTDALGMDYAPSNLFGISEIMLRPKADGRSLQDGAVIDLSGAGRVTDATMSRLLEQLATTSGQILTPELTDSLARMSTELNAVAPLLQTIVALTRTLADTQQHAPSFLIGQYASALQGLASLIDGSATLLDNISHIPVLRNDRALFDSSVDVITDDIVPAATGAGAAAQRQLGAYADLLAPLLHAIAATVPTPQRSGAELRQLFERIDDSFTITPNGPVLNIEVALRDLPAVAVPLLGEAGSR